VGETTAELIKIKIGNAMADQKKKSSSDLAVMEVRGRDNITGLPRTIILDEIEVNEAIKPVLMEIIKGVKEVLEQCPPELASDIIDKGIVMSGGSSLLSNFDKLMTEQTGVPCHVAEDSLLCVARGTGVAMENIELYKRSINKK
jgi:rod shape-determining protein MreB